MTFVTGGVPHSGPQQRPPPHLYLPTFGGYNMYSNVLDMYLICTEKVVLYLCTYLLCKQVVSLHCV